MPTISIILPVYNAGNYLRDTLDSVLEQTYSDFELIAVNDGSTDNSLAILQEYKEKDDRIFIIDKSNSGVSDTRNIGIAHAKGEYIAFLDADDVYSPIYLSLMFHTAKEKQADIVVCEYETFRGKANEIYNLSSNVKIEKTNIQELLDCGLMTSMQVKLFQRELLQKNTIYLDTNLTYGEDLFFCWKACLVGKTIYQIHKKLYGYRLSGKGATSKYHENLYEKYKVAFADLKTFCTEKDLAKPINFLQMDLYFTKRLSTLSMMCARSKMRAREKKECVAKILRDETIQYVLTEHFDEVVLGLSGAQYNLYRDAKDGKVDKVLRFGKRLQFRIILSKWKKLLRGR